MKKIFCLIIGLILISSTVFAATGISLRYKDDVNHLNINMFETRGRGHMSIHDTNTITKYRFIQTSYVDQGTHIDLVYQVKETTIDYNTRQVTRQTIIGVPATYDGTHFVVPTLFINLIPERKR